MRVQVIISEAEYFQTCDARKRWNPTTFDRIRHGDGLKTFNRQGVRVASGGVGWIWERLLPRLDVAWGTKVDGGENVLSCTRDP